MRLTLPGNSDAENTTAAFYVGMGGELEQTGWKGAVDSFQNARVSIGCVFIDEMVVRFFLPLPA